MVCGESYQNKEKLVHDLDVIECYSRWGVKDVF